MKFKIKEYPEHIGAFHVTLEEPIDCNFGFDFTFRESQNVCEQPWLRVLKSWQEGLASSFRGRRDCSSTQVSTNFTNLFPRRGGGQL